MLLGKYNFLGAHLDPVYRIWDKSANPEGFIVFLLTGTVPAIELIVDDATSASLQVLDCDGEDVGSPIAMTVEDVTTYKRLIYTGSFMADQSDGFYSLKVTNGAETYYFEMFAWVSSQTIADNKLLKITASLGDFDIIGYDGTYTTNMTGLVYEFYVAQIGSDDSHEIDEEANNNSGVNFVSYGNRAIINSFILKANRDIWIFLTGLRVLSANGTVDITWEGETTRVMDIEIEEDILVERMLYSVKFKYKVSGETVAVNNQVT